MTEKLKLAVSKYLKKKKENVIIDLTISNYNKANFYIALVFNTKIEKFKVLFIPLDVVEDNNIEEFVCYQFINVVLVNHVLESIKNNKVQYEPFDVRSRVNTMIDNYYIEINTHVGGDNYTFTATKYLPKEWIYFYEVILILFEHVPNVMSSLCSDILAVLDGREDYIKYQRSLDFDLFKDDLVSEFKKHSLLDVTYLEKVNGMYFAIVDDKLVIVDYINNKKILNLYCTDDDSDKYFYSCLTAIRNNEIKNFYKLKVIEKMNTNLAKYYLCFGIKNNCFKIIEDNSISLMPISKYRDGLVEVIGDNNLEFEKMIKDI